MFLESITISGFDALIPINRIKFIHLASDTHSYKIKIISDDNEWVECFESEKKWTLRYEQIKSIIKGK